MIIFKGLSFSDGFDSNSEKKFSTVQSYIDNSCISFIGSYIPVGMDKFRNKGKMSKSTRINKPGELTNEQPRARREYYTNKGSGESGTSKGGLRGKYWFERMKSDHLSEIKKGAEELLK